MTKENQTIRSGAIETWAGKIDLSTAKAKTISGINYWEVPDPYLQKAIKLAATGGESLPPTTIARYQRATILIDCAHPLIQILHSNNSGWWRMELPREYHDARASGGTRKFLERLLARAKLENKPDLAKEYEQELKRPGVNPSGPLATRFRLRKQSAPPEEYLHAKEAAAHSKFRVEQVASSTSKTVDPKPRPRPESPYSHEESLRRIHERFISEGKI